MSLPLGNDFRISPRDCSLSSLAIGQGELKFVSVADRTAEMLGKEFVISISIFISRPFSDWASKTARCSERPLKDLGGTVADEGDVQNRVGTLHLHQTAYSE
jgi:hypothetical protein